MTVLCVCSLVASVGCLVVSVLVLNKINHATKSELDEKKLITGLNSVRTAFDKQLETVISFQQEILNKQHEQICNLEQTILEDSKNHADEMMNLTANRLSDLQKNTMETLVRVSKKVEELHDDVKAENDKNTSIVVDTLGKAINEMVANTNETLEAIKRDISEKLDNEMHLRIDKSFKDVVTKLEDLSNLVKEASDNTDNAKEEMLQIKGSIDDTLADISTQIESTKNSIVDETTRISNEFAKVYDSVDVSSKKVEKMYEDFVEVRKDGIKIVF